MYVKCKKCKKTSHADKKKAKGMSRCANCLTNRSIFHKTEDKHDLENYVCQFLID